MALKATPARWWATHKKSIADWQLCKQLLQLRFGEEIGYVGVMYDGQDRSSKHVQECEAAWKEVPKIEWVHMFVWTLDTIPINWYVQLELQQGTSTSEGMVESFLVTFHFEDDNPGIDEALHIIKGNIFAEVPLSPYSMPSWVPIAEGALQCYHVDGNQEDEDPRDINIPETEGYRGV